MQVCSTNYTGEFHLKLFNSDIVCFEKIEKFFPIAERKNGEIIPVGVCMRYIRKIREGSFFGEVYIEILNGNICQVEVRKICKLKDITEFLFGSI
ncbi:MAG: hypothetical protein A2474_04060 [Elusimicrobia bacterium RIFOXYC2_FULL_34_12]|nr:MAG: hypothetical protein A2474_04060 [Elusimicrobia bacterium RIFOXYC2_FULL_34_12]OGS46697.1 MAG: hypothetical protein A2539_05290 [Elusimicrobia bacterium RIFOXYD2_FULL_34_15]HAM39538.1 hypothetical protein [Elusimicrobiota bacterium]